VQYYKNLLCSAVCLAICQKSLGRLLEKIIVLHVHVQQILQDGIGILGLRNHEPPSLHSRLGPRWYSLVGPLKEHLGGQKFSMDDEFKYIVLSWLCVQGTYFYGVSCPSPLYPWECERHHL
jgi:hypothetical protein